MQVSTDLDKIVSNLSKGKRPGAEEMGLLIKIRDTGLVDKDDLNAFVQAVASYEGEVAKVGSKKALPVITDLKNKIKDKLGD